MGAALCQGADDASLEQGYHEFAQEAQELTPRYQPTTATIDGWDATKKALQRLFPQITFILCFLHSWFSIKKRCRREKGLLRTIGKKVWEVYRSKTRAIFSQKIRHLGEWALQHLPEGSVRDKVIALCEKRKYFVNSYQHPQSPRTSNALDRLMDHQDRQLYATRGINGTEDSVRLLLRASAISWNFHPYQQIPFSTNLPPSIASIPPPLSPFERINGFRYHDHWLHNLLIASSLGGRQILHKKR